MQTAIILKMPDGRMERLPGNQVRSLLGRAFRRERTPELELIAQSVSSTEPGDGHMIDLARALLNSPVGPEPTRK